MCGLQSLGSMNKAAVQQKALAALAQVPASSATCSMYTVDSGCDIRYELQWVPRSQLPVALGHRSDLMLLRQCGQHSKRK